METLTLAPDWGVTLHVPDCDLKMPGCEDEASHGLQVHGCAFHYSCPKCTYTFIRRLEKGYRSFETMRCKVCKVGFSRTNYYKIVEL